MRLARGPGAAGPEDVWTRPGGTYRRVREHLFAGADLPFEVERVILPPGAVNWPYHAHSAMWECYLILEGEGEVRSPDGLTAIRAGDCFAHPPGEPHQMRNTGPGNLVYAVIADNAPDRTTIHDG